MVHVSAEMTHRMTSAPLHVEAALRRVATLAARGVNPAAIFDAIDGEVGAVFGLVALTLSSVDLRNRTLAGTLGTHEPGYLRGTWQEELSFDRLSFLRALIDGGHPLREDGRDHTLAGGTRCCDVANTTFVGCPVFTDGEVSAVLLGHGRGNDRLEPGCELRLAQFGELLGTSIINSAQRDRLRDFADTQAALRRVATLVAAGVEPDEVFRSVAAEAAGILGVGAVSLIRFDYRTRLFTKIFGTHGDRAAVPDGGSWPIAECPEGELILRTGGSVRLDDWSSFPGKVAAKHRADGFGQAVAAPVILDGKIWGHLAAFGEAGDVLPPASERKLADFTSLMATAIANAETRAELRGLASAQGAALRRVASLVATQASPAKIFQAVASEAASALQVDHVVVAQRHTDATVSLLGSASPPEGDHGFPLPARHVAELVARTGQSVRVDDWTTAPTEVATAAGHASLVSVIGAPIVVDEDPWGVIVVLATDPLPADATTRLTDFTHLVASSIATVRTRNELIASRARIVSASDEARRRIERDLHDGIQQRVVSLSLDLQSARRRLTMSSDTAAQLDAVGHGLDQLITEIQAFSQGLHPGLLTRSGLPAALHAMARRSPLPVDLEVTVGRLPTPVETAIYYAVCEGLANTTKHAGPASISIGVSCDGDVLHATIADDGCGGATLGGGSGLIGLVDRIEALGGRLTVLSPPGVGTRIDIALGLEPVAATELAVQPETNKSIRSPQPTTDAARGCSVVVADDDVLLREGISHVLADAGFAVLGQAGDARTLLELIRSARPDLAVVDVRMPPTNTREGIEAARMIRAEFPDVGILLLSAHIELETAIGLLSDGHRFGYLLKSRVAHISDLLDALERITAGDTVIDPALVGELFGRQARRDPLAPLTAREREVLTLIAEGRSNAGIAHRMWITEGAVEKHVRSILAKLDLPSGSEDHRRVLAVLTFLDNNEGRYR